MAGKRRNIIHRHARLRSGAGVHKTRRRAEVVSGADWDAAEYVIRGRKEPFMEMTLKEFREEHGISTGAEFQDALSDWTTDSVVPALCKCGCEVEPDGTCEHGNPSILIRMGLV